MFNRGTPSRRLTGPWPGPVNGAGPSCRNFWALDPPVTGSAPRRGGRPRRPGQLRSAQ